MIIGMKIVGSKQEGRKYGDVRESDGRWDRLKGKKLSCSFPSNLQYFLLDKPIVRQKVSRKIMNMAGRRARRHRR